MRHQLAVFLKKMHKHNLSSGILSFLQGLEHRVALLESANGVLMTENEQLRAQISILEAKSRDLAAINASLLGKTNSLELENTDLRIQLAKNSKNSDLPPSAEGYKKAPALPKPKGGVRGGKFDHEGKTLMKVATPDIIVVHHATNCACCGRQFAASEVGLIGQKRQVFDMPEPKLIVTEHQQGAINCCGKVHWGSFPAQVSAPVQYGTRLRALTVLLNTQFRMPFAKIGELTQTLFGQTVNPNTISLSLEAVLQPA